MAVWQQSSKMHWHLKSGGGGGSSQPCKPNHGPVHMPASGHDPSVSPLFAALQVNAEPQGGKEYVGALRFACGSSTCGGAPTAPPPPPTTAPVNPLGVWSSWLGPRDGPANHSGMCPCGTFVRVSQSTGRPTAVPEACACLACCQASTLPSAAVLTAVLRFCPNSAPVTSFCLQLWHIWADASFSGPGPETTPLLGLTAECSGPDQSALNLSIHSLNLAGCCAQMSGTLTKLYFCVAADSSCPSPLVVPRLLCCRCSPPLAHQATAY